MTAVGLDHREKGMSVLHALVVGAAVFGFLFVLLWAGEAVGIGPSTRRLMEALTQSAADASMSALLFSLPFAIAFGAIGGASLAIFANVFRFLDKH